MTSKKILAAQVAILACGVALAPSQAQSSKAQTTTLKLSVNDADDSKILRVDGPTPPHLSDAELQKVAEMKSKFTDGIEPKMTDNLAA